MTNTLVVVTPAIHSSTIQNKGFYLTTSFGALGEHDCERATGLNVLDFSWGDLLLFLARRLTSVNVGKFKLGVSEASQNLKVIKDVNMERTHAPFL